MADSVSLAVVSNVLTEWLTDFSTNRYVINTEAMKKLYKTMKDRPNSTGEPKDLSREWHSDCTYAALLVALR